MFQLLSFSCLPQRLFSRAFSLSAFLLSISYLRFPTFAFEGEDLFVKARSVQKTWLNCLASQRHFRALFVDVTFAQEAHVSPSPPTFASAGLNGATASDRLSARYTAGSWSTDESTAEALSNLHTNQCWNSGLSFVSVKSYSCIE